MTATRDPGASERVVWALRRAYQAVEASKEQRLRATGLSGAHYGVLINVAASPGLTGAALARRLRVTPQNVAGLVAKLVDRGLLERRSHPLHRHVLELRLTGVGRDILELADVVVAEVERDVVGLLGDAAPDVRAALERVALMMNDRG